MTVLHKVISDVLADHEWGLYKPGETAPPFYGPSTAPDVQAAKNLEWRCGCGWTTLDHHNGTSNWIDHCDHVAEKVVEAMRSYRMVDALVEKLTPYRRGW